MGNKKPEDPPIIKLIKGIIDIYYEWKAKRDHNRKMQELQSRDSDSFSMKQHRKDIQEAMKAAKRRK